MIPTPSQARQHAPLTDEEIKACVSLIGEGIHAARPIPVDFSLIIHVNRFEAATKRGAINREHLAQLAEAIEPDEWGMSIRGRQAIVAPLGSFRLSDVIEGAALTGLADDFERLARDIEARR